MKTKRVVLFMSVVICVLLIILVKSNRAYNEKQTNIDHLFKEQLSQTLKGLNLDYDKMEYSDAMYFYIEIRSGIEGANKLLDLTSFKSRNKRLDSALYELEYYLGENSSLLSDFNQETTLKLYDYLLELSLDINSEEKANDLKRYLNNL